jgi:hypothetical protein
MLAVGLAVFGLTNLEALAVLGEGVMALQRAVLVVMEPQTQGVAVAAVDLLLGAKAIFVLPAQAAQASSFSNGPSPYKSQIPLHLPVHG